MMISKAIKDYLIEIEIRKYTLKTIRGYKANLNLFCTYLQSQEVIDMEDLSIGDVKRFTAYMVKTNHKGTYINSVLKTVKSFVQYCYEEGLGGFNTKKCFKWCKEEKPIIRAFEVSDVKKLLANCKGNDFLSVRDNCIITMFLETGIRNSELIGITSDDIHSDFIVIRGKNHKERVVPLTPILKKAMIRYERCKENYFALKRTDKQYFLSFRGKELTPEANEHILKARGESIEGIRVSPHTCRHFYAQQQVMMGTDLYTISRLLGHENIQITQTYLNSLRDRDIIKLAKTQSVLMNMK